MKNKMSLILLICVFASNFEISSQAQTLTDSPSHYVVIGAFAIPDHAKIWIQKAKKLNLNPVSELNRNRNLYYVYVLRTDDKPLAFEEAAKLRKDTTFWDTWVYAGSFDKLADGQDLNPSTQKAEKVRSRDDAGNLSNNIAGNGRSKINGGGTEALPAITENTAGGNTSTSAKVPAGNVVPANTGMGASTTTITPVAAVVADPVVSTDSSRNGRAKDSVVVVMPTVDNNTSTAEPGAKTFFFKIAGAEAQNQLIGKVDIIDLDRVRKAGSYAGNRMVLVNPPNKSGNVNLVCAVFGYRKLQRSLNFNAPLDSGGVVISTDHILVPFDLVRLQKGDFAVMYNVYFFKDAAVMRPESKYEVKSLLDMMKENPKYKIRIHGHTNGSASGKVVSMGDSKNFFNLQGTHEGYGSAKKLSEERALMIRRYLVEEGIAEKRMEVKAWGGKKPVYDKMSPQAQANVRVEIEIVEDK